MLSQQAPCGACSPALASADGARRISPRVPALAVVLVAVDPGAVLGAADRRRGDTSAARPRTGNARAARGRRPAPARTARAGTAARPGAKNTKYGYAGRRLPRKVGRRRRRPRPAAARRLVGGQVVAETRAPRVGIARPGRSPLVTEKVSESAVRPRKVRSLQRLAWRDRDAEDRAPRLLELRRYARGTRRGAPSAEPCQCSSCGSCVGSCQSADFLLSRVVEVLLVAVLVVARRRRVEARSASASPAARSTAPSTSQK